MQTNKEVFEIFVQRNKEELLKLEKILKEADKKTKEINKTLGPLIEMQDEERKKLKELQDEYFQILNDSHPDIEAEIRANTITIADVNSEKKTMRQFQQKGKNEAEIKKEIKIIARKRAEKMAPIVREFRAGIYKRESQICDLQSDRARWQGNPLLSRKIYLERSLKDIDNSLDLSFGLEFGSKREQARIDAALATKGSYETKMFQARGLKDVYHLQINPIVLERDLDELNQIILEIENLPNIDKTPITIYYNQGNDHPNFGGGAHFRYNVHGWGGK